VAPCLGEAPVAAALVPSSGADCSCGNICNSCRLRSAHATDSLAICCFSSSCTCTWHQTCYTPLMLLDSSTPCTASLSPPRQVQMTRMFPAERQQRLLLKAV
jgi:hypothetical protein